jgi:hypothetical protein
MRRYNARKRICPSCSQKSLLYPCTEFIKNNIFNLIFRMTLWFMSFYWKIYHGIWRDKRLFGNKITITSSSQLNLDIQCQCLCQTQANEFHKFQAFNVSNFRLVFDRIVFWLRLTFIQGWGKMKQNIFSWKYLTLISDFLPAQPHLAHHNKLSFSFI